MIGRAFLYLIAVVLVMSILAADLPRITPSLVALAIIVLIGRVVWFYTR